jgi:hypothetical protein
MKRKKKLGRVGRSGAGRMTAGQAAGLTTLNRTRPIEPGDEAEDHDQDGGVEMEPFMDHGAQRGPVLGRGGGRDLGWPSL